MKASYRPATPTSLSARIRRLDWRGILSSLDERGYGTSGAGSPLLGEAECASLVSLWTEPARFRSRVDMARHRFGEGEYRYFSRPLPRIVEQLREGLYRKLAPAANAWAESLGEARRFPARLRDFVADCAAAGQSRPTPLLLRYEAGGYNCLHQDLYGEIAFPFQAMIPLSRPGADYAGGEFLLVEQRPRAQSAGTAILPARGELVIFANRVRPARGARGPYRANVRHGASRILAGTRFALAIIFHDAA